MELDRAPLIRSELNDTLQKNPVYNKFSMATLVKVIEMKNWEETGDEFILLLSSEDFRHLERETILSNEKPVEVLRDSEWCGLHPEISECVCSVSNSSAFPKSPVFIESLLPFTLPEAIPSGIIWARGRFFLDDSKVEVRVGHGSVNLFERSLRPWLSVIFCRKFPHALKFLVDSNGLWRNAA